VAVKTLGTWSGVAGSCRIHLALSRLPVNVNPREPQVRSAKLDLACEYSSVAGRRTLKQKKAFLLVLTCLAAEVTLGCSRTIVQPDSQTGFLTPDGYRLTLAGRHLYLLAWHRFHTWLRPPLRGRGGITKIFQLNLSFPQQLTKIHPLLPLAP